MFINIAMKNFCLKIRFKIEFMIRAVMPSIRFSTRVCIKINGGSDLKHECKFDNYKVPQLLLDAISVDVSDSCRGWCLSILMHSFEQFLTFSRLIAVKNIE